MKVSILPHIFFWISGILVLTLIYGVSYQSYILGLTVILMLIPVHMLYFYSVAYWIIPRYFFKGRYLLTVVACIAAALGTAILYRLNEILISDPYIVRFYRAADPNFTWAKLNGSFLHQLLSPTDFVNAVERSNVIVWIGVSFRFIQLWYERRQAALHAELNFLKGQIHPHFLFNTLNNLYALSLRESKQTPQVILGLSQILRYMLYECNAETVLLSRDLEILKNYVELEKIRYEDQLELNFNVSGDAGLQQIAPLLMLPLVENAFKHGVSETVDDPWINIDLVIDEYTLVMNVSNSKPETSRGYDRPFEKVGLSNVRKRLEMLYPGHYSLELYNEEELFIAILKLDLVKPAKLT